MPEEHEFLYLFPDTNLFVQCRPIEELDWTQWGKFEEVCLIVSRPIQAELDRQKNQGGARLARRARAASGRLRKVILDRADRQVVRPAHPCVALQLRYDLKPCPELADQFDYSLPDDQLVGVAEAFRRENPGADVRVLTHDGGPMASATMIGLPVAEIPDSWLLPPETSEAEKKIRILEGEIERLRKLEPEFSIELLDANGQPANTLELTFERYQPLSEIEIASLLDCLTEQCPVATDFGPRQPSERNGLHAHLAFGGMKERFIPASEEEIKAYTQEHYPSWLKEAEQALRSYHKALQFAAGLPAFAFAIENLGSRPGISALVSIEAKGDFLITPPSDDEDEDGQPRGKFLLELPRPPAPPRGKWESVAAGLLGSDLLRQMSAMNSTFGSLAPITPSLPSLFLDPGKLRRDPNGFYWKPRRPVDQTKILQLECEQWRHGNEPELFAAELHFDNSKTNITGALECRVEAENLSAPQQLLVPVSITVRSVGSFDKAAEMIQRLSQTPISAGRQKRTTSL